MKKIILVLITLTLIVVLTGCSRNRFKSHDMDYYIEKYNMTDVVWSDSSSLDMLGLELYYNGHFDSENNDYNNETEAMTWAFGKIDGKYKILYVPLNSKYDIMVLDNPFPDYDEIVTSVENYNELSRKECNINLTSDNYTEFRNLYDESLHSNEHFDTYEVNSSYVAKIGTCSIDDKTMIVGILSAENSHRIIIYDNPSTTNYKDIKITILYSIHKIRTT